MILTVICSTKRRQDKEPKGPPSARPFNRRGRGAVAAKAVNRNDQLPVGGKLVQFKETWTQMFPQHHEIVRKVSQGILIAFDDVPPSLLRYPLELPSNNKAADLQNAVQKLCLSRAIEEVMDPTSPGYYSRLFLVPKPDGSFRPIIDLKKLNQFIVIPSFKMETLFSIIAALQPQEWITKIDLKDAYHHILVHVNIRKYFRFVIARTVYQFRVLPFGLSTAPREFTKTLAPVVHLLRSQGIQVHAYLDDWIIRATSKEQSLNHTQHVLQLLQSLGWTINWAKSMLQPSRILDFLGLHFNLEQALISPPDSFLPTLTEVLSRLSPSTVMSAHKVSSIISRMSHFAPFITNGRLHLRFLQLCVQRTVDSTSSIMGHSNPSGFEFPFLPPLVSASISDDGSTVTSSGPQSLLLHGCLPQRLGSQLEGPTDLRNLVSPRIPTSHQLVRARGDSPSALPLGSSMEKSDSEGLLRQQYGSSVHPQTRRHPFQSTVSQDSGIIPNTGSICDNSHSNASPRSPERHRRCSVSSQSTQPNRMASPNRNLEQTVLCLRNSPDRHVHHSGEQGDAHLCFSLPRRQSMGGRRPVPILGRFGPSICISSGSHCSQDSPENTQISGHHGHHDSVSTSITTVASSVAPVEHTSPDTSDRRSTVPVCAQPTAASVPPRSQTIGSSRVALIRDVLKRHQFPDPVVDMAADPLRDSSSHVYNSHWKAFALWANEKGLHPQDLSFITLAEYLVHIFSQNKKVNTMVQRPPYPAC